MKHTNKQRTLTEVKKKRCKKAQELKLSGGGLGAAVTAIGAFTKLLYIRPH